jgi:hypothetical protein
VPLLRSMAAMACRVTLKNPRRLTPVIMSKSASV